MARKCTLYKTNGYYCFALRAILVLILAEVSMFGDAALTRLVADRHWDTFTSEDYPFRYRSNTFDTFIIQTVHLHDVIAISVEVMKLESEHGRCIHDYVDFYDGSNGNSTFLKRLCDLNRECFSGTNRTMFIVFRTDRSKEGNGFKIKYRSSDKTDICPAPALPFKWIGQLIGVIVSIIALCALWEFFKKKNGRDRMSNRCSELGSCCSDFASNKFSLCQNKCSCLDSRIRSAFSGLRGNTPEPSRVTPQISTLSNGRVTGSLQDRTTIYGVTSFQNDAFDDSEASISPPPPYPCDYTTEPPPYEVCVSTDQPHIDSQLPSYWLSQSESGNDVTTQTGQAPPPPSYDHVILNPKSYRCES